MRKYVCKFNVSCLRQVYASCSDVVNPTFCPVAAAVTDEGQPSLNTIDQSAVTSKCTSRAKVGV